MIKNYKVKVVNKLVHTLNSLLYYVIIMHGDTQHVCDKVVDTIVANAFNVAA